MEGQFDLFNKFHPVEKKSFEQEYVEYLASAAWKRLREAKIESVGGKCERCHTSKFSARLEVHHKTYARFKHERLEDLEVLCAEACHPIADAERSQDVKRGQSTKAIYKGFATWMDKGNTRNWRKLSDQKLYSHWKSFINIIGRQSGKDYSEIPFRRIKDW